MENYVNLAIRTEAPYSELPTRMGSIQLCRIDHAATGLCTELGELIEALSNPEFENHAKEEAGDLWWYNAIIHDACFIRLVEFQPENMPQITPLELIAEMVVSVGNIQDVCKRTKFYGKQIDHVRLATQICKFTESLSKFCWKIGVSPEEAQNSNISKLQKRYPGRFTEQKATVRDIESERISFLMSGGKNEA